MHTYLRKSVALVLAALALLSMFACNPDNNTGDTTGSVTTAPPTESVDPNYVHELPSNLNFNNTEVNLFYVNTQDRADELVSESIGGGVVSDAVYERNLAVEEQLGVKFLFESEDTDTKAIETFANRAYAGDTSIDIVSVGTYVCMTPALAGHYLNLNDIDHINLEKHYWNQDYNEMMTFTENDLQFVATCPAAISMFRRGYLTIFNRDLFEDHHLPNLYEVVKKGDWTLEYQYNLIKDIYVDKNGNSQRDLGDTYGMMLTSLIDVDCYPVASDIHLVTTNVDGDLVYNADAYNRLVEMSEQVSQLCNANGTHLINVNVNGTSMTPHEQFCEQNVLMVTTMFGNMETSLESLAAINYGIAPMPKLTKNQTKYGTYIQDQVSCFGISSAIVDEDRQAVLGAVLESLAYHSYNIIRPAYYNSTLSLRFMKDPESAAILDTMFESISFDFVYATGLADVRDSMRSVISSARPNVASQASAWKRKIEFALRQQKKDLDKLG